MQQVAVSWLAYRLTNSPLWLGVVAFCSQVPTFFLAPFGGALADLWSRRRMLLVTQGLSFFLALILALLTAMQIITVRHLLVIGFLLGCVNAVDIPTRQAFLADLVNRKQDLGNAIGLNSLMIHAARLIGPLIAGLIIPLAGERTCFFLNAVSYLAVIAALLSLTPFPPAQPRKPMRLISQFRNGLSYAWGSVPIRAILLMVAAVSLLGMPYIVLLPPLTTQRFHRSAQALGVMVGMSGIGALAGALYLACRKTIVGLEKSLVVSSLLVGLGLIWLSYCMKFELALLVLILIGCATVLQMTASSILLQTLTREDQRGRVMSFYAVAFMGLVPFGNLLFGSLAQRFSPASALVIGGAGCILASLCFGIRLRHWQKQVQPLSVQNGIPANNVENISSP